MSSTSPEVIIGSDSADAPVADQESVTEASLQQPSTRMPWLLVCFMAVFKSGQEWYQWAYDLPPHPVRVTIVSMCILGFVLWRVRSSKLKLAAKPSGVDE